MRSVPKDSRDARWARAIDQAASVPGQPGASLLRARELRDLFPNPRRRQFGVRSETPCSASFDQAGRDRFLVIDKLTPFHLWHEFVEKQNTAVAILAGGAEGAVWEWRSRFARGGVRGHA